MNKEFLHIITTRFNVPTKNWTKTHKGKTVLSEEWMIHRIELFLKFTFPSFVNQSNKNFEWLVFFDKNTKDEYWDVMQNLEQKYSFFKPIKVPNNEEMKKWILQIPQQNIKNYNYIISTNVDNDDAIHQDFVQNIQKLFQPKHNLIIDLVKGYRLKQLSEKRGIIQRFDKKYNAFVSVVEEKNKFESIYKEKHLNYKSYADYTSYTHSPMHIQVIHDLNKLNTYTKNWALYNIDLEVFGIKSSQFKIDLGSTVHFDLKLLLSKFQQRLQNSTSNA